MSTTTEAEFEQLSWHDNHLYGLEWRVGDPDAGDWTSDLVLDIDYIVEWRCQSTPAQFRVAPATLVFHGVTDLRIRMEPRYAGFQVGLSLPSIHAIERERIAEQRVYLDRPYYRWTIRLNDPAGGEIGFGAVGFAQTLRSEPILCTEQHLPPAARRSR